MPNTQSTALVTGASSGIGQAIAIRLARDGFHVLIHFHQNSTGAEATFTAIREGGGSAEVVQFDVRDKLGIESVLESKFPGLSAPAVLVNNAGLHRDNMAGMMSDGEFKDVIETNLTGAFFLMRWCVRRMISKRAGTIVNISSLAGQIGNAGQINYAASKAALIAMTQTLASEVGGRGIRVNAVCPVYVTTDSIMAELKNPDSPSQGKPVDQYLNNFALSNSALGRLPTGAEIADSVEYLASKHAGAITGQCINVDCGVFPQ